MTQLAQSITDVVKERNLSQTPFQPAPEKVASKEESDALKSVRDQLKTLQQGFDDKFRKFEIYSKRGSRRRNGFRLV